MFKHYGRQGRLVLSILGCTMLMLSSGSSRASDGGSAKADGASKLGVSRDDQRGYQQDYHLRLHHLHTGEDLDVVYRVGDRYVPEALNRLNLFLRDYRTQDEKDYDPREFDLLHSLLERLHRPDAVIDIVCGYRTAETNQYLRTGAAVTGVASHSQHMLAKAIDIRVPGVATATLRNAALSLQAGGVGYYPVSQFVHVDVGPVRRWTFR